MMKRALMIPLCILLVACETATTPMATVPPVPTPTAIAPTASPQPTETRAPTTPPLPTATATALPTVTPTSAKPAEGTPPPPRPVAFADYPGIILDFLNDNPGNWSALEQLLMGWGALQPASPNRWNINNNLLSFDIDGDQQQDILLAIVNPEEGFPPAKGMLLLYLQRNGRYRLAQQITTGYAGKSAYLPHPNLFAFASMVGNDRRQIVFETSECGAHTCSSMVDILQWDGQQLRSLMTSPPVMAYPTIKLLDSGHGTQDLVMVGGIIASAGAGVQRGRTEIYRWNGVAFALAETKFDPSNFLYFKVVDANALMRVRKYADAVAMYQEAITNSSLLEGTGRPAERADLQAFSRFRISVAHALLGNAAAAQAARDELLAQQPDHIYAQVSTRFWDAYAPFKDVGMGCRAVTVFARTHQAVPEVLNGFGYANPGFTAEEVCPFQ